MIIIFPLRVCIHEKNFYLFFIFFRIFRISTILCIRNTALKTKITFIKCPTLGKQNKIIAKNSPGVVLIFKIIKD